MVPGSIRELGYEAVKGLGREVQALASVSSAALRPGYFIGHLHETVPHLVLRRDGPYEEYVAVPREHKRRDAVAAYAVEWASAAFGLLFASGAAYTIAHGRWKEGAMELVAGGAIYCLLRASQAIPMYWARQREWEQFSDIGYTSKLERIVGGGDAA